MNQRPASVLKFDRSLPIAEKFLTGVSLHSHTMYSKEHLERLPGYIARVPIASYIIEREVGRLHLYTGQIFDFRKFYWTPPLSAREAFELEQGQIEKLLGLRSLVSLSDHDSIEAGLHLRMLGPTAHAPVSVEWSVPYEETVFHIGVHNLPAARAKDWMAEFERFTATPSASHLNEIFHDLNAEPSALVVLNHPYWDAESIGAERHLHWLKDFLLKYGKTTHALELNGLRSRRENNEVLQLAEDFHLPVVSGGDRHGCEPNAVLNLTNAQTFNEFVSEIREERCSNVILMPQYFEPLRLRLLENAWHALSDVPGEFGRSHWMSRIFIPDADGNPRPLSDFMGTRLQRVIDKFRWVMSLLASPQMRPALRLTFLGNEEGGL